MDLTLNMSSKYSFREEIIYLVFKIYVICHALKLEYHFHNLDVSQYSGSSPVTRRPGTGGRETPTAPP